MQYLKKSLKTPHAFQDVTMLWIALWMEYYEEECSALGAASEVFNNPNGDEGSWKMTLMTTIADKVSNNVTKGCNS